MPVTIEEPRRGLWLNNPAWGNTWSGAFPQRENTEFSVANLDSVPGPPRVITVNLGRSAPTYAGPGNSDFRALITYGVGAVSRRFETDWRNGQQISLVANNVRVDAKSIRSDSSASYSPNSFEEPVLTAAFARGVAGRSRPPTWSTPMQLLAIAATREFLAPLYADRFCLVAPSYPAGLTVALRSTAGTAGMNGIPADQLGPDVWVPLPVGQIRLNVANGSGALAGFWLVFELAL